MPSLSAQAKPLRVVMCGSAGAGNSALLGRLLDEGRYELSEQPVDGPQAAGLDYRCFATARRKFIVAGTPDHEQHTRSVVLGASAADLAIILVDARTGVPLETRRDSFIASLLGIRHAVLAVNKIDLVGYDEGAFRDIVADFQHFSRTLRFKSIAAIPLSARAGDNVVALSAATPWYHGPALLHLLETIETPPDVAGPSPGHGREVSDQFAAHVIWMHDEPLLAGRPYRLRIGARTVTASITEIKHKVDASTFQKLAAKTLARDDIGFVNAETHEPVAFDPFDANRETGAFILSDRLNDLTVGAGMIRFGLRRATNVHWQALDVSKVSRAGLKGQKPCCLWFTGLSGSGKSTIANLLEKKLHAHGRHTFILDGDNTRHGLNRDLGFTDADRVENIRRAAHVARLMLDAGLIVIVSFISPFEAERRMARELFEESEFLEIFIDAPLEVCEQRDPKGLYKKARAGVIQNFTGISSRYEAPRQPEMRLESGAIPADVLADRIFGHLQRVGYI